MLQIATITHITNRRDRALAHAISGFPVAVLHGNGGVDLGTMAAHADMGALDGPGKRFVFLGCLTRRDLAGIVPTVLYDLLGDPDPERSGRTMEAMLRMTKLDIARLREAAGAAR